jgi:hypothetical protein
MATESVLSSTPDVRYQDRDWPTLRAALIADAKLRLENLESDYATETWPTAIVELLAYLGDSLHYSMDAGIREGIISTARLEESVRRHAAYLGYEIPSPVASTIQITLELAVGSDYPIIIPAGTKFYTADGPAALFFQTLAEVTIPAGPAGTSVDIWLENSENFTALFTGLGTPNQRFVTNQRPVLLSGIDENGTAVSELTAVEVESVDFLRVDSFEDSEATSAHVQLFMTNGSRLVTAFGNGQNGATPTGDIVVTGRVGGGAGGNRILITQGPAFINTNGDTVSVTIISAVVSAGGADGPTVDEIRIDAPASLRTSRRTVSRADFIATSEEVPGVDRALPLTNEDDPAVPLNTVEVVIVSDSPSNARIVGGAAAATSTTNAVSDNFFISINGETPQLVDVGTLATGLLIAAAIQAAVRAMAPAFPLDNDDAYSNFVCTFDVDDERYTLVNGQAGLSSTLAITAGGADASVLLKISVATRQSISAGIEPSAATIAAVTTALTVTKPVPITMQVLVTAPTAKIFYIDHEVDFAEEASSAELMAAVRDEIRAAYVTYFSPRLDNGIANPDIDLGTTIPFSDLISTANGVTGVQGVDEDSFIPADDVALGAREFPVLGGVIVRDRATGDPV